MRVGGVEITEQQVTAMLEAMGERFRASDLIAAAEAAGVIAKDGVAMRAADRLLQRERKAQRIRIIESGPYWSKVQ